MRFRPLRCLSLTLLATLAAGAPAQNNLELGKMWTFENPPLDYLESTYGFRPTAEWLDALRLASLRFGNGCSASFVSPHGLIMTNHHCVRDYIAQVSPADQDWVKNGFYARNQKSEVKIPGLTVQQLVSMRDVTASINDGVTAQDDDETAAARREANQRRLLAEDFGGLRPQVVKLHQGAIYQLYLYKVYDDIRLVCAPHLQTAHFGGDPDNFTYPRYSIDFSFCRAYQDGAPADTAAHYFKWSKTGATDGELVFVTGNPGSTDRLKTKAQLDYLRDASYPMVRQLIDNRLRIMRAAAQQSPEQEKALRTSILMFENAQKAYRGYHGGLLDHELMARKVAAEADFKSRVLADPKLRKSYGDVWSRLEEIAAARTAFEPQRRFHSPGGSKHLARAIAVVRAVTAPDADQREQAAARARSMQVTMSPFERASFEDHLARAADWLPPSDPYRRAVLGGRTPAATAALLEQSAIGDDAFVAKLLGGGELAVKTADDPALRMAVVIEPLLRAKDAVAEWLAAQESALEVRVGQALFAVYGNNVSPDATFTLRFSDGVVKGFSFNGTLAPYRTVFYGLFARHTEFDGRHPFDLPQVWLDRRDRLDMTKAVNFVSTNDIIGGNSGSPIVNRELEVVGLIFDGNIEMLPNRFLYTDDVARAVSVHVDAITEALDVIYGADRVLRELTGS